MESIQNQMDILNNNIKKVSKENTPELPKKEKERIIKDIKDNPLYKRSEKYRNNMNEIIKEIQNKNLSNKNIDSLQKLEKFVENTLNIGNEILLNAISSKNDKVRNEIENNNKILKDFCDEISDAIINKINDDKKKLKKMIQRRLNMKMILKH